jgi:Acetyltransferase (GNAT) domain
VLIETERLSLRPMTIADLDQFVALRYVAPPFDRGHAIERLHADEREWKARGHGMLAILKRGSGRFLGRVALKYSAQSDETWFGLALHRDAWGHGFATEAGMYCSVVCVFRCPANVVRSNTANAGAPGGGRRFVAASGEKDGRQLGPMAN